MRCRCISTSGREQSSYSFSPATTLTLTRPTAYFAKLWSAVATSHRFGSEGTATIAQTSQASRPWFATFHHPPKAVALPRALQSAAHENGVCPLHVNPIGMDERRVRTFVGALIGV